LLATLENTSLAIWVGESLWAYPSLLACHIVGLAIVVGLLTVQDLKLLGFFQGLDYQVFSNLTPIVIAAFCLNALSGFLLFSSQASYLATSVPFLAKLTCIAVGLICAISMRASGKRSIAGAPEPCTSDRLTLFFACISLFAWTGAIIAGRLIAYIF
tara:strand:- start:1186 stop:1656 length:471 start_codon:yes stop_codon:yes gene_type:complete